MKTLSYSCMVEGLRPLVGDNGWDYCIHWRLSQDQRFLGWVSCCCCGTEASIENGGGLFSGGTSTSVQKLSPCRDIMFQHPRTRACDALSGFPSTIPIDSSLGIYVQALMSNQPTWQTIHETVGAKTRVLIPIPGGLVEMFVSKQVVEDQHVVDFVMLQCNGTSYEQATTDFLDESCDYTLKNNNSWISSQQMMPTDHQNFQWDSAVADHSQLYPPPLNLFDGSIGGQQQIDSTIDNAAYQQSTLTTGQCLQQSGMGDSSVVGHDQESVKQETRRANSGSEGSEDDDEPRQVGRNGKRHHCKNLMAERKRRKKLNDRLYALRAMVPKITKMDRASILGDAIEYVMELQKQVKDLQDELENELTNPEEGEAKKFESNYEMEQTNQNGMVSAAHGMELDESPDSTSAARNVKSANEQSNKEKGNQMEPQVEVRQLEANEFYLKILCEHKVGGFARLMEAISSLGLEVTNATVTTLQTLVLNVFNVQKRDDEMVQVDQVRDSLLELTRGPIGGWPDPGHPATNGGDYQDRRLHQHNHHHHFSSEHHLHHLH